MYSEKVKELVSLLPNRGDLPGASHRARGQNPICGDEIELLLRVQAGEVVECRFLARGCPAALASAAALTEICPSLSVNDCLSIESAELVHYLGGLPRHKLHGAELAIEVLREALKSAS